MTVVLHNGSGGQLAEVVAGGVVLRTAQDAVELIMRPDVLAPKRLIMHRSQFDPAFFDLRSGLAGDLLQKFATYQARLVIVGEFSDITSESFRAFVRECNRGAQLGFVATVEEAKRFLVEPKTAVLRERQELDPAK